MYQRILVPIARGEAAHSGLREALRIASRTRAAVRVIHVIDGPLIVTEAEGFVGTPDEILERIHLAGARLLHDARETARRAGIACESLLCNSVDGAVADLIARDASDWGADLVVLGIDHDRPFVSSCTLRRALATPQLTTVR